MRRFCSESDAYTSPADRTADTSAADSSNASTCAHSGADTSAHSTGAYTEFGVHRMQAALPGSLRELWRSYDQAVLGFLQSVHMHGRGELHPLWLSMRDGPVPGTSCPCWPKSSSNSDRGAHTASSNSDRGAHTGANARANSSADNGCTDSTTCADSDNCSSHTRSCPKLLQVVKQLRRELCKWVLQQ